MYNEEGNVPELLRRLVEILERVPDLDAYEIIAVDDGSKDGTLNALRAAAATLPQLVIVSLSRNFGHQIAATAGLDESRGDAVILMDGDLQDPPELILRFVEKWREGYDVVYATRRQRRGESPFKLFTARLFYRITERLTSVAIPVDTGDFRLMSRRVVDALTRSRERHRFLRGLVSWVGYRRDRDHLRSRRALHGQDRVSALEDAQVRDRRDHVVLGDPAALRDLPGFPRPAALAFVYAVLVVFLKFFITTRRVTRRRWSRSCSWVASN